MKGRKLTTISTLLSGAAAAALLTGTLTTGGQTAYASQMAAIGGTAATGLQVQNLTNTTATQIQMELFPQAGGNPITLSRSNVAGKSATNFYLPNETQVGAGAYGVVISSDQQIAAIARTDWTSGGQAKAAIYGTVPPAQNLILPLVVGPTAAAPGGYSGQISEFSIQNAGASGDATATVKLYGVGSATPAAEKQVVIGAGTSKTLKLGTDFTGLPDTQASPKGFVGYATIDSSSAANPLVAQSYIDFTNSSKAVYGFSAVPTNQASTTLYAPLLRRDFYGTTGVSLVNATNAAASVEITYYTDPASKAKFAGGSSTATQTVSVPARSSVAIFHGPGSVLPDLTPNNITDNQGWFGSAKMVSSQPITAIVNDTVFNSSWQAVTDGGYNAVRVEDGATEVFAPLVRRNHTNLTTGIQVQNVGSQPTNITVTFKTNTGAAAGSLTKNNVAPGASVNFYQGDAGSPFPNGQYGSAVVTSSGQPIALIVNDSNLQNAVDSAIYNGLK